MTLVVNTEAPGMLNNPEEHLKLGTAQAVAADTATPKLPAVLCRLWVPEVEPTFCIYLAISFVCHCILG